MACASSFTEKLKKATGRQIEVNELKIKLLLGSLCDLISGSGDKGTPVVLIQGYFDNYAS